jgi:hypothetical protein
MDERAIVLSVNVTERWSPPKTPNWRLTKPVKWYRSGGAHIRKRTPFFDVNVRERGEVRSTTSPTCSPCFQKTLEETHALITCE